MDGEKRKQNKTKLLKLSELVPCDNDINVGLHLLQELGAQLNLLRKQQDNLERQLEAEREAHEETKEELEELRGKLEQAREDGAAAARDNDGKAKATNTAVLAEMALQTKVRLKVLFGLKPVVESVESCNRFRWNVFPGREICSFCCLNSL